MLDKSSKGVVLIIKNGRVTDQIILEGNAI